MTMDTITGYGNLPKNYDSIDTAQVVIVPVPYDETSSWLKGADKGPQAIIEASSQIELYDIETDTEVYKIGIATDDPVAEKASPEKMVAAVNARVVQHLEKGKFVVILGGEHSVSIGTIKAHASRYNDMTVLQLDAHSDLRDEYLGSKYNHACVMARVKEHCPIVQVGIRSMDRSEKDAVTKDRIFFSKDIVGGSGWIENVVSKLSEKVYITIDLDVFDISIMPATGTAEPGGLLWYDVLSLLKKVTEQKKVIGFDIVELCPNKSSMPYDFLAAKLIYQLLSYIFMENSK